MLLGLPRLACPVVHVEHVLDGLVAVGVVPHVHDLHLPDLVDRTAVVAVVEERWNSEYAVQHGDIFIVTTHKVDKALGIVEYAPGVVEAVAFGEVASPLERAERSFEGSVHVLAHHQLVFRIIEVPVIHGCLCIRCKLLLALAECLSEGVDAPVVVGIFKGPGSILIDSDIAGDVAETVVILPAEPSGRLDRRVYGVRSVGDGLPEFFGIVAAETLDVGSSYD